MMCIQRTVPEPDVRGCDVFYTVEPRIYWKSLADAVDYWLADTETRTLRAELYRLTFDVGEERAVIEFNWLLGWSQPIWAVVE